MFDVRAAFGYDKDKANQGVNHVFGPNKDTDWVTICKLPNKNYDAELKRAFRDNHERLMLLKSQGDEGSAAASALDSEIHNEVIAKTIVTNWGSGMSDGNEPLPYTVENCVKLLAEYPDFKIACMTFAENRMNFPLSEDIEEVKK